jgi:hypothetical protein
MEITKYTQGRRLSRDAHSKSALILLALVTVAISPCSGVTISFSLDTSRLARLSSTQINFQLIDGDGTGNANNTVVISDISLGGGLARGAPIVVGGASGDLDAAITLTDSSFFNSFLQHFTVGDSLSFTAEYSTNVDAGLTPDGFSLAILQKGSEIPTTAFGTTGSNVFLTIDFNSGTPSVMQYELDYGRYAAIYTPEPASLTVVFLGCAVIAVLRLWRFGGSLPSRKSSDACHN